MSSVCLLSLCGLPAAGKTSFVRHFFDYMNSSNAKQRPDGVAFYHIVHIVYDELIPMHLETASHSTDGTESQVSKWKLYRTSVLQCLDKLLMALHTVERCKDNDGTAVFSTAVAADGHTSVICAETCSRCTTDTVGSHSYVIEAENCSRCKTDSSMTCYMQTEGSEAEILADVQQKFCKTFNQVDGWRCTDQPAVIIVDDNMYYASMRYQLYQLARKHGVGYAQLYIAVSVSEALDRNSRRAASCRVADDVILGMAHRLDIPCMTGNGWEKYTETWTAEDSAACNFGKVISLISVCLDNPVLPASDEYELVESRQICSTNVIHQADCILRHLLTEHLAQVKAIHAGKELSARARRANLLRQEILQQLRSKQLLAPSVGSSLQPLLCPTSPLYTFIQSLFLHRLRTTTDLTAFDN